MLAGIALHKLRYVHTTRKKWIREAIKDDKKVFSGFFALVMLFCTLFAISVPASAATYSSGTQTRTITVVTKSNYWIFGSESITLSQSKGTCVTSKQYGEWNIVVKATDGSHTFKKTLTDSSIKLNLKPNKTYRITVTWDRNAAVLKGLSKGSYTAFPTWRVKSTWKVSNYY